MKNRLEDLLGLTDALPIEKSAAEAIEKATESILADERLLEITENYYGRLFVNEELLGREICEWQDEYADKKLGESMLFTVIMFARAAALNKEKKYIYGGCPIDFFKAAIRHFEVNVKKSGSFGFKSAQRFWAYIYLKPIAFELGRLAFEIIDYFYDYEVYQSEETGESIAFICDGVSFDEKGMPEIEGAIKVSFEKSGDTLSGYTYTEEGHLDFEKRTVKGFRPAILKGDKVITVHMPGNEKLSEESVEASFLGAEEFFHKYFADLNYKAFVCSSWLLDTGLKRFLSESSNILKLQRRFKIGLAFKNDFSLFDNVFNVPRCPIEELVPTNKFQQGILDMVKKGGTLYSGRGYILK